MSQLLSLPLCHATIIPVIYKNPIYIISLTHLIFTQIVIQLRMAQFLILKMFKNFNLLCGAIDCRGTACDCTSIDNSMITDFCAGFMLSFSKAFGGFPDFHRSRDVTEQKDRSLGLDDSKLHCACAPRFGSEFESARHFFKFLFAP